MPKVILTLQRTGGKPHGVVLKNAAVANQAALALIRGFLIDTCSDSACSHHVTVERVL